jgi:hypothetical protein
MTPEQPEESSTRPLVEPLPFLILAGIGLAAIAWLIVSLFRPLPIPAVVSEDFTRVAGAVLKADVPQSDPGLLATTLSDRVPAVGSIRVPDLRGRGFSLIGGTARDVSGKPGVLAIYRNAQQELLVWQAYVGAIADLPATTDVREHAGRRFLVHRKASHILVFWQEGTRVQVVTASLPAEQVVSVAFAAEGQS